MKPVGRKKTKKQQSTQKDKLRVKEETTGETG